MIFWRIASPMRCALFMTSASAAQRAGALRRSGARLACANCHGPGGRGEPPAIPYLAGQYAHYTASQLRMWQQGSRKTNLGAMGDIVKKLDDGDIDAPAAYFQQVIATPPKSVKAKE